MNSILYTARLVEGEGSSPPDTLPPPFSTRREIPFPPLGKSNRPILRGRNRSVFCLFVCLFVSLPQNLSHLYRSQRDSHNQVVIKRHGIKNPGSKQLVTLVQPTTRRLGEVWRRFFLVAVLVPTHLLPTSR